MRLTRGGLLDVAQLRVEVGDVGELLLDRLHDEVQQRHLLVLRLRVQQLEK